MNWICRLTIFNAGSNPESTIQILMNFQLCIDDLTDAAVGSPAKTTEVKLIKFGFWSIPDTGSILISLDRGRVFCQMKWKSFLD